ncbi:MAG TPA: DUF1844 domain-containing protein [Acidimicrobiales bacterium]|nr:DUF1844 domain-containing protein [Acidimicrobiales bacterium]
MSSLWTPGGERPVPRSGEEQRRDASRQPPADAPPSGAGGSSGGGPEAPEDEAELRERMTELRQQLADTPARTVVANHCYGMFELAALHLSLDPPKLDQARLAIDALALLVEGLATRLGEEEAQLREGLTQLRLAFVRLGGTTTSAETPASGEPPSEAPGASGDTVG